MKRIVLLIFALMISTLANLANAGVSNSEGRMSYDVDYGYGFQGDEEMPEAVIGFRLLTNQFNEFQGFSFYWGKSRCFQFVIDDYKRPTKEEMKEHLNKDRPYVYLGRAEYYVEDDYPDIKSVIARHGFPLLTDKGETLRAKRTATAVIRIEPFKKCPQFIYVRFDGVCIKFTLSKSYQKELNDAQFNYFY